MTIGNEIFMIKLAETKNKQGTSLLCA